MEKTMSYESELEDQNERLRYELGKAQRELEKAQRELDERKTPMESIFNTVDALYNMKWRVVVKEYDRYSGPSGHCKDFPTKDQAEEYAEEMRYPKDRSGSAPDYYVNAHVEEL